MTYDEIVKEVVQIRFKASQRASVKRWVNSRYQTIWAYADWPWKRQGPVDLTIIAGNANPAPPTGFLRPVMILDDLGGELDWLEPDEFDRFNRYLVTNGTRGRPSAFKWTDNVITLAPTPNTSYRLALVYDRKPTVLAGGTTPAPAPLSADSDVPIWDEQYHYILVLGAIATGLRLENDPTYPQLEEEYEATLMSMQDYYLPTATASGHLQYGRDAD